MYDAKLKGKNALVTNSTSGVGLTIAKELMAGGCNVMLSGYGEQNVIEEQRQQLEKRYEVQVGYLSASLSDYREVEALLKETGEQFGSLDILVNNSSAQNLAMMETFTDELWEYALTENLSSAFYAIRRVLPSMKHQAWGRIINIATAQGLVAAPEKAGYVAAKYGLVGLTKVVGEELKSNEIEGFNVTCNALCPGLSQVATFAVKTNSSPIDVQEGTGESMDNQLGQLILFLCSDAAADINGEILPVSG